MKNLFYTLLFICSMAFGQEKPVLTKSGFEPLIITVEGKTAQELYAKTKEWVQYKYKNPSEVLKADIPNDMIRINGFQKGFYFIKSLGMKQYNDVSYSIEFNFKEGKYRFSFAVDRMSYNGNPIYYDVTSFVKDDGTVRGAYETAYNSFMESLQKLIKSHKDFASGITTEAKKDW